MDALTIDDVFRSVILVTLKSSHNSALRTAYDQILDDLDDDKDLTFAHIQTRSVLANLGEPRSDTRIHLTAMTPGELRRAPRPSKPRSTTSTNIKEVTNSPPSSVTPLKNMVNSMEGPQPSRPRWRRVERARFSHHPLHDRPETLPRLGPQ